MGERVLCRNILMKQQRLLKQLITDIRCEVSFGNFLMERFQQFQNFKQLFERKINFRTKFHWEFPRSLKTVVVRWCEDQTGWSGLNQFGDAEGVAGQEVPKGPEGIKGCGMITSFGQPIREQCLLVNGNFNTYPSNYFILQKLSRGTILQGLCFLRFWEDKNC